MQRLRSIPPITACSTRSHSKNITSYKASTYNLKSYKDTYPSKITRLPIRPMLINPEIETHEEKNDFRIIIDLRTFSREEISIDIDKTKHIITVKRKDHDFKKEIGLPGNIDWKHLEERFNNGIFSVKIPWK